MRNKFRPQTRPQRNFFRLIFISRRWYDTKHPTLTQQIFDTFLICNLCGSRLILEIYIKRCTEKWMFMNEYGQNRSLLAVSSHLPKKTLMWNFSFHKVKIPEISPFPQRSLDTKTFFRKKIYMENLFCWFEDCMTQKFSSVRKHSTVY